MTADRSGVYCHPFDRSGLGTLSDLQTDAWKRLYHDMEKEQHDFLAREKDYRSPDYKWPRDPLHTWSRCWEYPYVYHHMQRWRQSLPKEAAPTVIDFGCGVTFFPFVVSRLGCQVVGIDNDPVCQQDLDRAAKTIDAKPGEVSSRLSENGRIPGADASIDAIYSVSVLEHIPACEKFIPELARLLKPSGLLVLTIDMDLRGDQEIGVQGYRRLRDALDQFFDLTVPEVTAHPADLLKTSNGPFPIAMDSVPKHLIKKWIAGPLRGRQPKPRLAYDLAVMGIVARKK